MNWLKLYTEAANDKKLATLDDAQFRVWFNLLCMAGSNEPRGTVEWDDHEILALEVAKCDTSLLLSTLQKLRKLRMIEGEDGCITFAKWEKRQSRYPSDEPAATAERQRKRRERLKNQNVTTVTSCHDESRSVTAHHDASQNSVFKPAEKEVFPEQKNEEKNDVTSVFDLGHELSRVVTACHDLDKNREDKNRIEKKEENTPIVPLKGDGQIEFFAEGSSGKSGKGKRNIRESGPSAEVKALVEAFRSARYPTLRPYTESEYAGSKATWTRLLTDGYSPEQVKAATLVAMKWPEQYKVSPESVARNIDDLLNGRKNGNGSTERRTDGRRGSGQEDGRIHEQPVPTEPKPNEHGYISTVEWLTAKVVKQEEEIRRQSAEFNAARVAALQVPPIAQ